jgi:molybdopterin-guanine dinucleotide biosynthesis protein A
VKVFGLVLAGGRSSRFGREKAAADLAGRPLIAWVVDVLAQGCAEVAVNAKAGSMAEAFARGFGLTRLTDDPTDPEGPLAGVRAGLAWARAAGGDALVTAPCDTPFLPQNLTPRLMFAAHGGARAAVACTGEGLEPLCALWRVHNYQDTRGLSGAETAEGLGEAAPLDPEILIAQAFATGRHPPMRDVLAKLAAVEVMFPDARAFANLNTQADYIAAVRSARAEPE